MLARSRAHDKNGVAAQTVEESDQMARRKSGFAARDTFFVGLAAALLVALPRTALAEAEPVPATPEPPVAKTDYEPPLYGQWRYAGWGGGGFFWCAVSHPTDPKTIYLGGDVAGIYKTEDQGRQWRFVNNGLKDYAIYSIALAKSAPDTLYAMTYGGICKTTDGGKQWQLLPETAKSKLGIVPLRHASVRGVAIDPTNPDIVYAGSAKGQLYKTEDGGKTWRKLDYLPKPAETKEGGVIAAVAVSEHDPKVVLMANNKLGVFRSQDAGATWTKLATPDSGACVAFSPHDPRTLAAAFWNKGIMLSTDNGETWTAANSGLEIGDKAKICEVQFHAKDPNVLYAIGNREWSGCFYRSSDGGKTWKGRRSGTPDFAANPTSPEEGGNLSTLTNIAVSAAAPDVIFLSANWRNWLSLDGGETWRETARGADISCIEDIRFFKGKTYASAMDEGLLVSEDNGLSWKQLCPRKFSDQISGHQWRIQVSAKGDTERIVSTSSPWNAAHPNQVLISEDGGKTFSAHRKGLPDYIPGVNCMWGRGYPRALAADPGDSNTLYLGIDGDPEPDKKRSGGGVFKTADGGRTWTQLPQQPGSRRMFFGLAVDPTDPKRIFWATCGTNGGLYRSENGGESWEYVFKDETWLFNVTVDPKGNVYTGGGNLVRSTDHGKTWQKLTNFSDKISIVGLEVDPQDERRIWISRVNWGETAGGGVQRTTDGGATWEDITGELPYVKPMVLRYNAETRELWAGGVGLFRAKQ
jgi:photosystem II stability/assembly factor-like uncharacterized protein